MIRLYLLIAVVAGIALLILGVGAIANGNAVGGLIPAIFGVVFIAVSAVLYRRRIN